MILALLILLLGIQANKAISVELNSKQWAGFHEAILAFCTNISDKPKICMNSKDINQLILSLHQDYTQKINNNSFITAYSLPTINARLIPDDIYNVPVYGLPFDKADYNYSRKDIDQGALQNKAPILVYLSSKIELFYAQTQGSFRAKLADNSIRYIGYGANNGKKYVAIGNKLIQANLITQSNWNDIAQYLQSLNDAQLQEILNLNPRYIFFQNLPNNNSSSSSGAKLVEFHTLAADTDIYPFGTIIWLEYAPNQATIAIINDTGSAIKGEGRFDLFLGKHLNLANSIKYRGNYAVFTPINN